MSLNRHIGEIVGKRIVNVVTSENSVRPQKQVFLVFDDGTEMEFFGESFGNAKGLCPNDLESAKAFNGDIKVYPENQHSKILEGPLDEYQELHNELVAPAYRKFCEENHLQFHFWDRLPKEAYDPKIALKELELHNEAMNLFNRLKPDIVLFKDNVIRYQITEWGGAFKYTKWTTKEFIEQVTDELFYLKNLEKRHEKFTGYVSIIGPIFILCFSTFMLLKFAPWGFIRQASLWIGIVFTGAFCYWLSTITKKIPKRIREEVGREKLTERLSVLRENLAN